MFDPTEHEEVKNRLPLYLGRFHAEKIVSKTAHQIKLRCPYHSDKTASFIADDKSGVWLWRCFGCNAAGSTFESYALDHSLDPRSGENIKLTAQAVGVHLSGSAELTPEEKRAWAKKDRERRHKTDEQAVIAAKVKRITAHLHSELESKLAQYRNDDGWKAELWESSPLRLEDPSDDPRHFIAQLFHADDILWAGETYESGQQRHSENFRTCRELLKLDRLPPRIAAGAFRAGSISRSLENVMRAPFIVLESDELIGHKPTTTAEKELNKAMSYAFFLYAQDRLGLTPRAVIDTGNKSLHLFFDRPPPDDLAALLRLADGLRIDRGLLEKCAAAPLRMPNCIHEKTNRPARLLYLNPIF